MKWRLKRCLSGLWKYKEQKGKTMIKKKQEIEIDEISNLQIMCRKCNSSKHNKTMEEFEEYLKQK